MRLTIILLANLFGLALGSGCCTLDYKQCINWCGTSQSDCENCSNPDVGWLPNGAPSDNCGNRWTGCAENNDTGHSGCCPGLVCQLRSEGNYMACLPPSGSDPVPEPTNPPVPLPTNPPVPALTNPPVPLPTDAPASPPTEAPAPCVDPNKQYKFPVLHRNKTRNRHCKWVSKRATNRCKKTDVNGVPIKEHCPLACNNCPSSPTEAPVDPPTDAPISPTTPPVSPTDAPVDPPTDAPVNPANPPVRPTEAPVNPTNPPVSPTEAPVNPTNPPVSPTEAPVDPTNPPVNSNGCCSLDHKHCVDWCGSTFDECSNCGNPTVIWLNNGALNSSCGERWTGCGPNNDESHSGCCPGLTCQWEGGYNACLPGSNDPTDAPVTEPTPAPVVAPTQAPVPTPAPVPTEPFFGELLHTDKALNAWEVFQGLDYITHKNDGHKWAVVASGGAAGSGTDVVSESQAYGLLITGTVLASWDTHASKVSGSDRSQVLEAFRGYYNFWKDMCASSNNPGSNCQGGGNWCKSGSDRHYCLPDWKHSKFGGTVSTGPAPDADEDAIVGIILAVKAVENDANKPSWYDEARKWADASASALFEYEIDKSKGDYRLMKLGSCWGGWGSAGNNPSYHSPGSYRVMKDYQASFPNSDRDGYSGVDPSEWQKLIDTSYEVLGAVQCENEGALVPNWATVDVSGGDIIHTQGSFSGSGTPQYEYGAEAARTTFRVALDAAFYPERSDEWSPYISAYNYRMDQGFGGSSISGNSFSPCKSPGTSQNINMFGDWQNNAFIYGPTYTSLIAASPDVANREAMIEAAGEELGRDLPGSYYPRSWAMISALMLNGAMESAGNTLKQ